MSLPLEKHLSNRFCDLVTRASKIALCAIVCSVTGLVGQTMPVSADNSLSGLVKDPAIDARNRVQEVIKTARPLGYIIPEFARVVDYPDETILELDDILKEQSDACLRAAETAVFLDAHSHQANLSTALRETYETGIAGEIFNIWVLPADYIPDEYAIAGKALELLKHTSLSSYVDIISTVNNVASTYEAVVTSNAKALAARRGVWVQEIVHRSIVGAWDENLIVRNQGRLDDTIKRQTARLIASNQKTDRVVREAEMASIKNIKYAKLRYEADLRIARHRVEDNPIAQRSLGHKVAIEKLERQLKQETDAAIARRDADINAALALRDFEMSESLQLIAKACVQQDALSRYSLPIARGQCETIRKKGVVEKAIPCEKGDVLCKLTRLPHDRLMSTLKALGVEPSQGFLNCVCRTAGYGSPGASQFYDPNTIGEYDVRYACQQPGPPCIVAGYGCTRNPLPRNNKIWIDCGAAEGSGPGGENPVEAFMKALTARAEATK